MIMKGFLYAAALCNCSDANNEIFWEWLQLCQYSSACMLDRVTSLRYLFPIAEAEMLRQQSQAQPLKLHCIVASPWCSLHTDLTTIISATPSNLHYVNNTRSTLYRLYSLLIYKACMKFQRASMASCMHAHNMQAMQLEHVQYVHVYVLQVINLQSQLLKGCKSAGN